ncbi:hypothetical protein H0486_18170 [Lachnospiraceae bacterium MD1]|uniref:Uncharacterized protein n=1 Tax=Variimorphobacter saccharofermentans TaxID=2755051 RepID=A0A839K4G4_9FIRM|nr:hypothetical protein [Variimorphobacter saccharofermentans]MBB2184785.1 hypothetical protein [Variimorphobacter saccharofermentans]
MSYEELNTGFINLIKAERNKILNNHGRHSIYEKELQNILIQYADLTGQDIEVLNEATDKNKFYEVGQVI